MLFVFCICAFGAVAASAAVTEPPAEDEVIWDLVIDTKNNANVTVTDNSQNCTSSDEAFPKEFEVSNTYLSYYMYSGTNTESNPGTVDVSVFGNESVSFTAGKTYSVYFDYETTDRYADLENAKLTLVLFAAETGEIKTTVGEVDVNKSTYPETVTETVNFTPETDITDCKVGFTFTGNLISDWYNLKVHDLTVVQVHVHNYNEYAYVSEEQCAAVCSCGADDPDSEPIVHSFVDGVCENCQSAQSYLVKNGDVKTKFVSWMALISYINQNDNCTVTLLREAVMDNNDWIERNLTIDLAGHKFSNFVAQSSGRENGEIQVRITDSSEGKTGEILHIDGIKAFIAYDGSQMVVDGIRTSGSFGVDSGGSMVVNNVVTTSSYNEFYIGNGSMTVNGGEYAQFIIQMGSENSSASVKDIACTLYEVRDHAELGVTIGDTLADGYTFVDAEGNLFDVSQTKISGDISTQTHTHEYTSLFYNDTEHWTACACGVMADGAVTEAHKGGTASCTAQAACEVCEQSYGELAVHTEGTAASCTERATCAVCGQSYGETLTHTGGEATCTAQAVCDICGNGYGEMLAHKGGETSCTARAVCTVCGNEYGELLPHTEGTPATCTSKAICVFCQNPYGELAPHTERTPATCIALAVCDVCNNPYGDYADHTGGTATCIALAVCEVCDQPYGELADHEWGESSCTVCGVPYPVEVTALGETVSFTSLQEALDAIYRGGIENARIKLVDDMIDQDQLMAYSGHIVLDLNGYTLSVEYFNIYRANLTVKDTSEDESGVFLGGFYLAGSCNLIIDSGYIDGGVYLAPEYGMPNVNIKGGKFSERFYIVSYGGDITVSGGAFAYGIFGIADEDTQLDVVGGEFEGGIYIESENGEVLISDIIPDASCVKYLDADGNEISADAVASYMYEGYVKVIHEGELESGGNDTFHWSECKTCGVLLDYDAHSGEATCTEKAVCEVCGVEYGMPLPHDYGGETCVACGAVLPIKVIVGEEEFLFDDMADAMAKASEYESAKIVLQANVISIGELNVSVYGNVELDLAGYTVYNVEFDVYGSLTVGDSSEAQSGTISGDYAFCVYGGSLTVNSGHIDASSEMEGEEGNKSVITINGGRFTGQYGVDVYDYSELYINGGLFDCDNEEIYLSDADLTTVTVVLSGGEFPNGLHVVGGNVYDVLTEIDCIDYLDENGDIISVELLDAEHYEGYITVGHNIEEWLDLCNDAEKHWYECSDCDYASDPVGHDIVIDKALAATCTATGLTEGAHCAECDHKVAQDEIPALGHDLVVDKALAATCTATGLTEGKHCTRCDHKVAQEEIPALGHDLVVDKALAATCTATGLTEGEHCTRCDYKVVQEEVSALGHSFGDWVSADDAEGNHWKECACGEKTEVSQHTWDDGEITKEATATEEGVKTYTCTVCGHTKDESIAKLPPQTDTPQTGTPPKTDEPNGNDGLSGGAIAGIAAGSAAVVGCGGFSLFWFVIKKKKWSDLIGIFKKS